MLRISFITFDVGIITQVSSLQFLISHFWFLQIYMVSACEYNHISVDFFLHRNLSVHSKKKSASEHIFLVL